MSMDHMFEMLPPLRPRMLSIVDDIEVRVFFSSRFSIVLLSISALSRDILIGEGNCANDVMVFD